MAILSLKQELDGRSLSAESYLANDPARVLSMQEWKKRMPKQSNGDIQDKTTAGPPRPKKSVPGTRSWKAYDQGKAAKDYEPDRRGKRR